MTVTLGKLGTRVGNRGSFLLLFGGIFVLFGLRVALDPRGARLAALATLMPPVVWGYFFVASGAVAATAAFVETARDVFGFAALMAMSLVWSLGHFWSAAIVEQFPWVSLTRELMMGGIFAVAAALVHNAATWPEKGQVRE